jgi:hypothetical protein
LSTESTQNFALHGFKFQPKRSKEQNRNKIKPNPVQNDTPLINFIETMCIQLTSSMRRVIPKWIQPIHHEKKNEWQVAGI